MTLAVLLLLNALWILCGAGLLYLAVNRTRAGFVTSKWGEVSTKKDKPIYFWFSMSVLFVLGVGFLLIGLLKTYRLLAQ